MLQRSLEMSLEEQYATEDTEDENNTGNEMDNKEEGEVKMMDNSVPHENKEESMNGKLSAIMYVRSYSLIAVFQLSENENTTKWKQL